MKQTSPAAAELLRLCAFLHPAAIPEEMITKGAPSLGSILEPIAVDPLAFDTVMGITRRHSLLQRNAEQGTLSMHRLVQTCVKEEMEADVQRQWAERATCLVQCILPDCREAQYWRQEQRYLSHALAIIPSIYQWNITLPQAGGILLHVGNHLLEEAHYTQARELLQQAHALLVQNFGEQHPQVAESFNSLACSAYYQRHFIQAEELFQRSLAIYKQTGGPDHRDVAMVYHNLAVLFRDQGKARQAGAFFQRALTIYTHTLGATHPSTLNCLHHLAVLYRDQGNYRQAEVLFQQVLEMREQMLSTEHPHLASTLHHFGKHYALQGETTQALSLYARALSIRQAVLGSEHPDTQETQEALSALQSTDGRTNTIPMQPGSKDIPAKHD